MKTCPWLRLALIAAALAAGASGCTVKSTAGPDEPFEAEARPRNPDHFILGNGVEVPMPYEVVRSQAVAAGVAGMADYSFQDWLRPSGTIRVDERGDGATRFHIELDGLVPGGFYTAWLVRLRGSARGDKRDLALGQPYGGPPKRVAGANTVLADDSGRATLENAISANYFDPAGTVYYHIDFWDEIHVAFHADNRAYGFVPGPGHWTQVVLPIHPGDGSALLSAIAVGARAFSESGVDFDTVKQQAVTAGVSGFANYGEADWAAARGAVTINHASLGTQLETYVTVTADGLVPGAPYSAWLLKSDGTRCPVGGAASGTPGPRALFSNQLDVDPQGRGELRAILSPESACSDGKKLGAIGEYIKLQLRLHANNVFPGLEPDTQSYAQLEAGMVDPFAK
ncbi:MAG: hypothetical protein KC503_27715 [Myxococcales bacterium]|nr:hypothetical protein [Myxococcales bacterium]